MSFHVLERTRVTKGPLRSSTEDGNNGAFTFTIGTTKFFLIASEGGGWEHVSVSTEVRTPTWEEMCMIKNLFWDEDDCVVQYHPPKSSYVNNHRFCLHLWRPIGKAVELPPRWMVGV